MHSADHLTGASAGDRPFPFAPVRYQSDDGRHDSDPCALFGAEPPRYSLVKLASYFTGPALYRDFRPECPWAGITLERPEPPAPGQGTPESARALPEEFRATVRAAMGDYPCAAVAFSGGMDSAAVLYAAWLSCRAEGRRLVAVTLAQRDDEGQRTDQVAARVAEALGIRCDLVAVDDGADRWREPVWTPAGPRFDAEPRLHRALAEVAAERGAGVLLHGLGADQLLRAPRFLAGDLLLAGRPRAAMSFAADRRREGGLRLELAALAARGMRASARASSYLAFARRDMTEPMSPVLTDAAAAPARQWLADAVRRAHAAHARRGHGWAAADAIDALYPIDMLDPSTELAEQAPFLMPRTVLSAWRIPLAERYSDTLDSPYFRRKALVLALLPGHVRQALVPRRQRGYWSYSRYWQTAGDVTPRLEELGLIRRGWRERCRSAFDAAMVHACERWVNGADERGARPLELTL